MRLCGPDTDRMGTICGMERRKGMKRQKDVNATKVKYKVGMVDRIISALTYIIYTIFAFVCVYPFYYIFINTISSNDLSQRGKVLFWPKELHFNNYQQVMQIP